MNMIILVLTLPSLHDNISMHALILPNFLYIVLFTIPSRTSQRLKRLASQNVIGFYKLFVF